MQGKDFLSIGLVGRCEAKNMQSCIGLRRKVKAACGLARSRNCKVVLVLETLVNCLVSLVMLVNSISW